MPVSVNWVTIATGVRRHAITRICNTKYDFLTIVHLDKNFGEIWIKTPFFKENTSENVVWKMVQDFMR